MKNEEQNLNNPQNSALNIADVSGSLSHGEELKRIRQRCLNSTHPLRFIQYSIDEAWYMNERNNWLRLNFH